MFAFDFHAEHIGIELFRAFVVGADYGYVVYLVEFHNILSNFLFMLCAAKIIALYVNSKFLLSKWCVVKKTRVESGMLKVMITFVGNYCCLKKQHILQ